MISTDTRFSVKVIAEAGVNHNGDEALAHELVRVAFEAGADAVKFQTFNASKLVTKEARLAEYQARNASDVESQHQLLKQLELGHSAHIRLASYCADIGIEFLSTAFDKASLRFLVDELDLKTLKISSGDLTDAPLMLEHARTGRNLIVSTGMSSLDEIERALEVIAFGFSSSCEEPTSWQSFSSALSTATAQQELADKVTLLHCTTEYPAPAEDINLRAMETMASRFSLPIGYSDHSAGIVVSVAAVAMGATVIEKHFTLDKGMEGPDHKASLDPDELSQMIRDIRVIENALGDGEKKARPSELGNRKVARKSLVASTPIDKGDVFTESNLTARRPGTGLSPIKYWDLLGTKASRDYEEGDEIRE